MLLVDAWILAVVAGVEPSAALDPRDGRPCGIQDPLQSVTSGPVPFPRDSDHFVS